MVNKNVLILSPDEAGLRLSYVSPTLGWCRVGKNIPGGIQSLHQRPHGVVALIRAATPGAKPCCRRILRIHMQIILIVFWGGSGAGNLGIPCGVTPRVSVSGMGHHVVKHSQPHAKTRRAARGELSSWPKHTSRARTHFRAQSKFTKEPHTLHAAHILQARSRLIPRRPNALPAHALVRPGLHQPILGPC